MGDVPETMPAAVLKGPGRLEVEDVPVPSLGVDDVLVQVDLCGVCGSDLHMVLDGWGAPGSWQGHEWVGRVAAVGDGVTRWQPGDVVVGGPTLRCGICPMCQAGRPSLCAERDTPGTGPEQGAFAAYKATGAGRAASPARRPRPASRRARRAAGCRAARHPPGCGPAEAIGCSCSGAGPIGALSIAALRALGVDDVRCAEPAEHRRALAADVGATAVVHPADLVVPSIAEPGLVVDDAVDVVLECSGKATAMEAGLAQLVRGGRLVLVGAGIESPRFDPNRILLNELVVTGAFTYDQGGFDEALRLLASGALPVEALLEPGEIPLDGLLDAMRDLAEGRRAGKVLVRP